MAPLSTPKNIDEYISGFTPEVQAILAKIRSTIHEMAPEAQEKISYRMPAFVLPSGVLIYFAAFKTHIGMYPPVKGDETLQNQLARYAGEKGNLKFPFVEPIPFALIKKVVKFRLNEHRAKRQAKRDSK